MYIFSPFLIKYPLYGIQLIEFWYFCKVLVLVKNKEHLTTDGLEKIVKVQQGMNRRDQKIDGQCDDPLFLTQNIIQDLSLMGIVDDILILQKGVNKERREY